MIKPVTTALFSLVSFSASDRMPKRAAGIAVESPQEHAPLCHAETYRPEKSPDPRCEKTHQEQRGYCSSSWWHILQEATGIIFAGNAILFLFFAQILGHFPRSWCLCWHKGQASSLQESAFAVFTYKESVACFFSDCRCSNLRLWMPCSVLLSVIQLSSSLRFHNSQRSFFAVEA